jgi:biopolymer transport protein ExbD
MAMTASSNEGKSYSDINMTPLIDVMLVLLIIFIITIPTQTRATLPSYITREAAKTPQPEVHITVDKFSRYQIVAQTLADLQLRGLKKIGFVNNDFL